MIARARSHCAAFYWALLSRQWRLCALSAARAAVGRNFPRPQCGTISPRFRADAQKAVRPSARRCQRKAERKGAVHAVPRASPRPKTTVVKFLEDNKVWCGVPEQAIKSAKANHEKTLKFRTAACNAAPTAGPKPSAVA